MVKHDGRTCIYEKRLKKGAVEHGYYVRDVRTGWQNLYIGKKIEKGGRRNMNTV